MSRHEGKRAPKHKGWANYIFKTSYCNENNKSKALKKLTHLEDYVRALSVEDYRGYRDLTKPVTCVKKGPKPSKLIQFIGAIGGLGFSHMSFKELGS